MVQVPQNNNNIRLQFNEQPNNYGKRPRLDTTITNVDIILIEIQLMIVVILLMIVKNHIKYAQSEKYIK